MTQAPQAQGIVTTNVPADATEVWQSATEYSSRDIVQYADNIYTSLADVNIGNIPSDNALLWYREYATNQKAMFDPYMDTVTENSGDIVLNIATSDCDIVALFGLWGESVHIEVMNNTTSEIVYDESINLVYYDITDWWEWTYNIPRYKKDIFAYIPMSYDETISVTIENRGGVSRCAYMTYGRTQYLGCTQWGSTTSRRSNVKKERYSNGHVYLEKGISWKRISVPVRLDTDRIDTVQDRLEEVDGVPTLFIGDETQDFESLLVFGFYRDLDIPISITKSLYTIEIEGL